MADTFTLYAIRQIARVGGGRELHEFLTEDEVVERLRRTNARDWTIEVLEAQVTTWLPSSGQEAFVNRAEALNAAAQVARDRRERVGRAMHESRQYLRPWTALQESQREDYRQNADAAIALLDAEFAAPQNTETEEETDGR